MKHFITVIFFCCIPILGYSQDYKKFKFGWRYGYNTPIIGTTNGLVSDLEPAVRLNYYYLLFLNYERQRYIEPSDPNDYESVEGRSLSLGVQNYFYERGPLRFYAGFGLGVHLPSYSNRKDYTRGNFEYYERTYLQESDTRLLFHPRIGFDYYMLNVLVDFNLIQSSEAIFEKSYYNILDNTNGSTRESRATEVINSYIAIKLGISIGGGQKD